MRKNTKTKMKQRKERRKEKKEGKKERKQEKKGRKEGEKRQKITSTGRLTLHTAYRQNRARKKPSTNTNRIHR